MLVCVSALTKGGGGGLKEKVFLVPPLVVLFYLENFVTKVGGLDFLLNFKCISGQLYRKGFQSFSKFELPVAWSRNFGFGLHASP